MHTFQIIITSADGTQRRRFPRKYWQVPTWTIERYGFYADFSLPTSLDFTADTLPSIVLGDRVEFLFGGKRRYRGYITAKIPSEDEPQKLILSGYGAAFALGKQRCDKRYAFVGGGVDVSAAFAAVCRDFVVGTNLPGGVPAVASVQALPVGITTTALDAWDKLFSDVAGNMVTASGNLATWGADVDPSDANRVFLRPVTSTTGLPTHVIPVPGRNVEAAAGEQQSADIINDLLLLGGPPQYPQLLHNGNFELPVPSGERAGNLVANGDFEDSTHTSANHWAFNVWATTDTDIINTPARSTAFTGSRFLVLEPTGTADQTIASTLTAGHTYTFSLRVAKEIEAQTALGRAFVTVNGSSGALLSFTLPLTPSGQTWDYFSQTFTAPAAVTSITIRIQCDTLTSVFGQPGGLVVDDVELYDSSIVYQDGWETIAFGTGHINTVNWVYQDEVQDGGYSVYLDVSADDADDHDAHLQPPDPTRITVQPGQALRFGAWVKSPSNNPNAPFPTKVFLEMLWYKSGGGYDSKIRHTETLGASVGGVNRVNQWTYIEVSGTAPNGVGGLNIYLTFRSSGVLVIDTMSIRDLNAPAMGAADASTTATNPYLPTGNLRFQIDTNSSLLPVGNPYSGSIATWGRRAGVPVTVTSVLTQADFLAYADSYFRSHALPMRRPAVTLVNDPRLYLPGETVLLIGKDGPLLAPLPLPIVRVRESFEDELLKCSLELSTEQPDQTYVENQLILQNLARYGVDGSASSTYSDSSNRPSGGGLSGGSSLATAIQFGTVETDITETSGSIVPTMTTYNANKVNTDATTAETVAARVRLAVSPFAANTYASLKAHMDGLWTAIATLYNRTITTGTGLTGGGALTSNLTLILAAATASVIGGVKPGAGQSVAGDGTITVQRSVAFCVPGSVTAGADTGSRFKVPSVMNGLTLIALQARIDTVATANTSVVVQLSTATGVFAAAVTSQTLTIPAGSYETSTTTITTAMTLATDNKLGVNVSAAGTGGADLTVTATYG